MKVNEIEGFAESRVLHYIRHFFAQFPTLRSQAHLDQSCDLLWPKRDKQNPKRTAMTSLVSPGLSFQTVLWFSGRKCKKTTKWSGMTSLGSPGLSSQHVSGFSGRKGRKIPETDRHDKPGKPRLVIPIRFGIFWPERE